MFTQVSVSGPRSLPGGRVPTDSPQTGQGYPIPKTQDRWHPHHRETGRLGTPHAVTQEDVLVIKKVSLVFD